MGKKIKQFFPELMMEIAKERTNMLLSHAQYRSGIRKKMAVGTDGYRSL